MKTRAAIALLLFLGALEPARSAEVASLNSDSLAAWTQRVERGRSDYLHFLEGAMHGFRKAERAAVTSENFLDDSTLQSGDVVVTEKGLMMFSGDPTRLIHNHSEFKPIGKIRSSRSGHLDELLAIQKVSPTSASVAR